MFSRIKKWLAWSLFAISAPSMALMPQADVCKEVPCKRPVMEVSFLGAQPGLPSYVQPMDIYATLPNIYDSSTRKYDNYSVWVYSQKTGAMLFLTTAGWVDSRQCGFTEADFERNCSLPGGMKVQLASGLLNRTLAEWDVLINYAQWRSGRVVAEGWMYQCTLFAVSLPFCLAIGTNAAAGFI